MVSSIYNKVKFVKNSYLSKLELVNKFNLDQVDKVPFVDRVTVEFSISKFLTAFYGVKKYEYSLDVQIKFVLVVYLLVFNFPFINYKSIQSQEKVSYRNSGDVRNFSLKITLTGKDIIEKFLIKILNENNGRFNCIDSKYENVVFLCQGYVYLRNVLEVSTFLNRILHGINLQDLFFNLILRVSNPSCLKVKFLPLYS